MSLYKENGENIWNFAGIFTVQLLRRWDKGADFLPRAAPSACKGLSGYVSFGDGFACDAGGGRGIYACYYVPCAVAHGNKRLSATRFFIPRNFCSVPCNLQTSKSPFWRFGEMEIFSRRSKKYFAKKQVLKKR